MNLYPTPAGARLQYDRCSGAMYLKAQTVRSYTFTIYLGIYLPEIVEERNRFSDEERV
jgi:hypothetical protein